MIFRFRLCPQVYIVTGGHGPNLASTETLDKDGDSAWQLVASLPSKRFALKGVGLDKGRFLVTGQSSKKGFKKGFSCMMHGRW